MGRIDLTSGGGIKMGVSGGMEGFICCERVLKEKKLPA